MESPRQMFFLPCHFFLQEINNNARASQPTDLERIVYIDSEESVDGFTLIWDPVRNESPEHLVLEFKSNFGSEQTGCAVFVHPVTRIGLTAV